MLVGLACCVVPAVAVLVWAAIPHVGNNLALNEWKAPLGSVPAGSTQIDAGTDLGTVLHGNGNHCDAVAWIVVQGPAGDAEIAAFYEPLVPDDRTLTVERTGSDTVRVTMAQKDLFDQATDLRCS